MLYNKLYSKDMFKKELQMNINSILKKEGIKIIKPLDVITVNYV